MPSESYWQPMYNAFDPWERLWGKKLDYFYVEREHSPLKSLMTQFRPGRDVRKTLFVGHRGSGKSTELLKLVSAIGRSFVVVWLDAHLNLETLRGGSLELLFLMGVAAFRVAVQSGFKPERRYFEQLTGAVQTLVREQTGRSQVRLDPDSVLTNIVCYGLPVILGATAGPVLDAGRANVATLARERLLDTFSFGVRRDEMELLGLAAPTREITSAVNLVLTDVEKKAGKPVLLIVDGLDRLAPDAAQRVFESRVLAFPDCRAIYVTPIALRFSANFAEMRQEFALAEFPNITLHQRGEPNEIHQAGLRTMREVARCRLRTLGYDSAAVISRNALNLLAKMSGGVMREMVSLMREAIVEAEVEGETQIRLRAARSATYKLRRQYAAGLHQEHYETLKTFLVNGRPSQGRHSNDLLRNLYILSYMNDQLWYDVHPNVRPLLDGDTLDNEQDET
jgi:hypothetical protein